jgi:hypothetical protein
MGLFKSDLYRSFGVGFLIGALMVGASLAPHLEAEFASPAKAATADAGPSAGTAPDAR